MVKEPDHKFLHYMCETFQKHPDDSFFEDMDPVIKLWWYESWVHRIETEHENAKAQAIFIGSFTNPEAARRMVKQDTPDVESSDDDFEKSMQMVRDVGKWNFV